MYNCQQVDRPSETFLFFFLCLQINLFSGYSLAANNLPLFMSMGIFVISVRNSEIRTSASCLPEIVPKKMPNYKIITRTVSLFSISSP
jgi:hypothetical protein